MRFPQPHCRFLRYLITSPWFLNFNVIKQVATSSFTFTALITLKIQLCLPLNHTPTPSTAEAVSSAKEKEPAKTS